VKLGLFNPIYGSLGFEEMLDRVVEHGLEAVELACGNYPGDRHCRPASLLDDSVALQRFQGELEARRLHVSALSCHGNPIHPDASRAASDDAVFRDTVRLASALGVGVVNVFSGNPGGGPNATEPNWITCSWPTEYGEMLSWQWDAVVIPYWQDAAEFALRHGVNVAVEMHPGFVVYNPRTLLRLRSAVGENVGANMDPSHLFWQGIDPLLAVRDLTGAIFHVDAKDTGLEPSNIARNGVLDQPPLGRPGERPWMFRSVGDGHDLLFWKRFVSALRMAGYDGVISIEHEDSLASADEGIARAVATLRAAILSEPATASW
jgi:sugar phosphate isomerase/epimerase